MRSNIAFIILLTLVIGGMGSCTKLDEKLGSTLTREQADSVIKVAALLVSA